MPTHRNLCPTLSGTSPIKEWAAYNRGIENTYMEEALKGHEEQSDRENGCGEYEN
jgi:hypothetical protein